MKTHKSLSCLLALASLLGLPLNSRAATVVVNTLTDGGPGSLREAVDFAATNPGGAMITFDPALSGQIIALTNGGQLVLTNQVTIDASALPKGITVSAVSRSGGVLGLHITRVFLVAPGAAVELDNLTIQGGYAADNSVAATDVVFGPGNDGVGDGGGILITGIANGGMVRLDNCILRGNYAQDGGGGIAVLRSSPASVILNNCILSNNIASYGGGVYCLGPILTVNNSTLSGNAATIQGGGTYGPCTLNSSSLYNNFALRGGGGILSFNVTTLNNSTVAGNTAPYGAGIGHRGGSILLNNSTVSGNAASVSGGGIEFAFAFVATSGLTNSIVAGNSAPTNSNLNRFVPGSNSLTNGNPLLAPLGNYGGPTPTMPPLAGSPALDAGTDSVTNFLATDQRGYPRLSGAHVDIGAVEAQGAPANNPPLLSLTFTSAPNADFTVLASTNLSQWNLLGPAAHNGSGQYQFTDPNAANHPKRFYKVASP